MFGAKFRHPRLTLGAIFTAATWAAFFSRSLLFQRVYFLDDLKIIYYPLEYAYALFQKNWQLPQWSPYFGFGHPLLAWAQLGFFTPLHVALRALSLHPITLLQISVVAYFALGASGMYVFLRRRHLTPLASAAGSIIFTFCGFNIGHLNHVNFYVATMWLPWLLLSIDYFFAYPKRHRAVAISIIGAIIALSSQPQIALYVFIIAALYSAVRFAGSKPHRHLRQTSRYLAWGIVAAILAASAGSLAILPLSEFLPHTERNSALPPEVLIEFSYPPYHAITLLFPYFFGDHSSYWGAKGFQELAAFVGVVPLLLSITALWNWRHYKNERITAILLISLGICIALGKHSPLYTYLVDNHIVTTLAIPGRFVFFINVGLALLSALGLYDLQTQLRHSSLQRRLLTSLFALSGLVLLLTPFAIYTKSNERAFEQLLTLHMVMPYTCMAIVIGLCLYISALLITRERVQKTAHVLLVGVTAITLLMYGWNYNPMTTPEIAYSPSALAASLRSSDATPARLYATGDPITNSNSDNPISPTDQISPSFSVYQPITVTENNFSCVNIRLRTSPTHRQPLKVSLHSALASPALREIHVPEKILVDDGWQHVCFEPFTLQKNTQFIISVQSNESSGTRLFTQPSRAAEEMTYFVRKPPQSIEDFLAARKPLTVLLQPEFTPSQDYEAAMLARHMQSLAHSSSARWIGALSIRPYREFIEQFFANDREPLDGDGRHAILSHRNLLDMAGVTHVAQLLPIGADPNILTQHNFQLLSITNIGSQLVALYRNPQAMPKVFLVPEGQFKAAADETRHAISARDYDFRKLIYVYGPRPPTSPAQPLAAAMQNANQVTITRYEPTLVEVNVYTEQPAWLVLNDSSTPQWHTYINDRVQPYYVANSIFKTAYVPAGTHTVSFRYHSPATALAVRVSIAAWTTIAVLLLIPTQNILTKIRAIAQKTSLPKT